jgi:hypothetical protein
MLNFYSNKYDNRDIAMVLRALTYFKDAESQPEPFSFEKVKWKAVKDKISLQVKQYFLTQT